MKEFEKLSKLEKKLFRSMERLYQRNLTEVQKELAAYYTKYGDGQIIEYRALLESLTPAERDILYRDWEAFVAKHPQYEHLTGLRAESYKINRLEGLEQQIKLGQYKQGIIESAEYEKHLENITRLGWNASLNGQGTMLISDSTVKMIANTMYVPDGTIASEILGKKARHAQKIWNHIKDGFIRGDSYDRMSKIVEDRFNINYRDAKQWVYTEGSRCINEGKAQGFRDMGYTRYIYRTMEDEKVCGICEAMNGEEFAFADREAGTNFPPLHTNCRCSFEVVNDEISDRPNI